MSLQRVEIITEGAILLFSTNFQRFKLFRSEIFYCTLCVTETFPWNVQTNHIQKMGKSQTYFFHFISHPYISYKNISSAYIPCFFLLFSFTYTFTYLLYEGSSMKFWSTGVPCLDVMGLDTPLESFCHTEGTVDK